MHLERDPQRLRAGVGHEPVQRRARPVHQHVANLEEVALEPGEREGVHPVAEVVPDAGVLVLVQIAHRNPLGEEGGVEEADQPPVLAAPALSDDRIRAGDLSRGVEESESA